MKQTVVIPRELRVSHSEAESFTLCERQHFYGYGMHLRRNTSSVALNKGSLGHNILANYFTAVMHMGWDVDFKFLYTKELAHAMKQGFDPESINQLLRIFAAFENVNPFRDYDILGVEKDFNVKVSEDFYFAPFIIDLIIRHKITKKIYIVDHKFMKDFLKPWDLDIMPQIPKYIGGLRILGYNIEGAFYHVLRTGFAKSKPVPDTDIIQFEPFNPSEKRVVNTMLDQVKTAEKIRRYRALPLDEWRTEVTRTANKMVCQHCSFKSICVGDLEGHNTSLLLKTEYTQREQNELTMEVELNVQ